MSLVLIISTAYTLDTSEDSIYSNDSRRTSWPDLDHTQQSTPASIHLVIPPTYSIGCCFISQNIQGSGISRLLHAVPRPAASAKDRVDWRYRVSWLYVITSHLQQLFYDTGITKLLLDLNNNIWYFGFRKRGNIMSDNLQSILVSSRIGRIVLHLACISQDHKFIWHIKGIWRETILTNVCKVKNIA